jgi:RNA polymerase sigma-B factor
MSRGACFSSNETDDDKERAEARLIIGRAMETLEESERRLIWLRFFEQRSQSDIAAELGISQMQVSRLLTRLLLKLRSIIGVPDSLAAAS